MFPNFAVPPESKALIQKIVMRALENFSPIMRELAGMHLEKVLIACHSNGCPLDLQKLLEFDDVNFWHDLDGIEQYLHKPTGWVGDYFVPRSALRQ
jgi:hypothetical protein